MNPETLLDRRRFLAGTAQGMSSIALASMLQAENAQNPNAPRAAHFPGKAKNVIVVFCSGALSHVDTFDYKPELIRRHGQPLPGNEKLVS
ncbi:DUF1501 domain-containing protein, partial [bacterium]|nr:DUF1501 domain-containing protein [bacterium]